MQFTINAMLHQGGGSNKIYIGILDDRAPVTVYGPNSPGASGVATSLTGARMVTKKLNEKLTKGYKAMDLKAVPAGMITTLDAEIRRRVPNIPVSDRLSVQRDGFVYGDPTAPQERGAAQAPKRRKTVAVWI